MKKAAVILSGCGVFDGSEIYETTLTLLALDKLDVEAHCFAPDIPQCHVINHASGEEASGETRSVLVESARLARGNISPLADLRAEDFDFAIFPGGFGAAKNLSDFAVSGEAYAVQAEAARVIRDFVAAQKPLGLMCIAPVLVAKVLGDRGVCLTIGKDPDTAAVLSKQGARHIDCEVTGTAVDEQLKVVTTPAYMLGERIRDVAEGIERLVEQLVGMA